jgi:hypothetical protein
MGTISAVVFLGVVGVKHQCRPVTDGNFRLGFEGTFTRNVFALISASAFVNSASKSRRGSNACWRSNVVRIAELDTTIRRSEELPLGRTEKRA